MTERPIIFGAESVLAIFADRKTQTRRVIRSALAGTPTLVQCDPGPDGQWWSEPDGWIRCPFGAPGDRLWVKELLRSVVPIGGAWADSVAAYEDGVFVRDASGVPIPWRWKRPTLPARFMPRAACRLVLDAIGVRPERLQEITEEDARAEGCAGRPDFYRPDVLSYLDTFREGWNTLNAKRGYPWANNDWVWAVEFRRAP